MAKRTIAGKSVAITGASSGIGRALAIALAQEQARLVLNARRTEKLADLAGELRALDCPVELVAGDITEAATRQAIVDRSESVFGGLDILVNNAGIGAFGRFEQATPDRLRRIMEVNFFALVEMTRLALPLLRKGSESLIVNIASILGHRGIPRSSEYCASKFAVRAFSQSLRAELARDKIGVLVVSPGTTETDFFDSVIDQQGPNPWPKHRGVPAATVARATLRAMRSGKHEIIPSFPGRLLTWFNRLSPRLVDKAVELYG
jgi:short-subunit dehydrogenase